QDQPGDYVVATGHTYSVRSSSSLEDMAQAAFAGQHETFLNCSTLRDILEKTRLCYLSLWSDRAAAYRHKQGLDHAAAEMAVVVQRMAKAEAAGVGFSVNPVSGDLQELVFDANFGLGESVVSGESAVDHFLVDKKTRALRSSKIAVKTLKISPAQDGVRAVPLSAEEGARPCLDAARLGELSSLLLRVEESFGFPQDIEWAFAEGKLHLLQSRPITSIAPRWTREESAERFPNVITPLTWDFVDRGFHLSLAHSLHLMGLPPFKGKWFGLHGHYVYGNQNAVQLYARRAPVSLSSLDEARRMLPRLREEFQWVQDLPSEWNRDLDRYLLRLGEFSAAPLASLDIPRLWDFVRSVDEHGARYFLPNIAISLTQGFLHRFLSQAAAAVAGEREGRRIFDGLLAFCETKTGAVNRELFELSRDARSAPALEKLILETPSRRLIEEGALGAHPAFQERFAGFLRSHGHRETDFDPYHPTWAEAPWVVLDNIRLLLKSPPEKTPAQRERELKMRMREAEERFLGAIPPDLRFFFHEVTRLARAYTALDDAEHYQTTRLSIPLRRGLRELGSRLVEKGVFSDPMDVFFARAAGLDEAVGAGNDAGYSRLAGDISRAKAEYLKDKDRTPEWVLGAGEGAQWSPGELSGIPGSPGEAEGEVCVVRGPEDFARFPKGAVLVARTTNPAWTPLFYCSAAVVTESGGPLSHGAVTARERGIPAVMSVPGVLDRLKDGARVRVDGTRGRVVPL
ncbi:MAG: PEP/pyruvate-binding domain-containing protein, partial [Elusimicrobiota bacterium]